MFFNEKIERLKKIYQNSEFSVPFSNASQILKSIENKFIIVKDLRSDLNNLRQYHNSWAENIKDLVELKAIEWNDISKWIAKLDTDKNYWVVLVVGSASNSKHMVYDCKPSAITSLTSLTRDDFYIVDKKYLWLAYFKVDNKNQDILILKSGQTSIPFEE